MACQAYMRVTSFVTECCKWQSSRCMRSAKAGETVETGTPKSVAIKTHTHIQEIQNGGNCSKLASSQSCMWVITNFLIKCYKWRFSRCPSWSTKAGETENWNSQTPSKVETHTDSKRCKMGELAQSWHFKVRCGPSLVS